MDATTMEAPVITFETRRDMSEYFAYWKSITRDNARLPSRTFLLHDLILNRDPKKGSFSPITNKNKLANGSRVWQGLEEAVSSLSFRLGRKDGSKEEKKLVELSGIDPAELKNRIGRINYK